MDRMVRILSSYALLFLAAIPLWACGQEFQVAVTWTSATEVEGKVELDGEVKVFQGVVGPTGCIEWDIDGCKGKVCGMQQGTPFKITCKDPLLAEWPIAWTLTSGTWSAPGLGMGGALIVDPAGAYVLPDSFGVLVTDPGYSAWVLKLDFPGPIPPTHFVFDLHFTVLPGSETGCIKGLDVAVVDLLFGPDFIVPTAPELGVDFTAFDEGDFNVLCLDGPPSSGVDEGEDPTPAPRTWGKIKTLYREP